MDCCGTLSIAYVGDVENKIVCNNIMHNLDYFKNKKVTIVGLARSGFACAQLLFELGADVSITDIQDTPYTRLNASKLRSKGIKIELGAHTQGFIKDRDFVVVSPGVPDYSLPVTWAKKFGIPLIGEIEVGWILCPAEIIAVTGSNGKTTVTTLIARVLEEHKKRAFVCGNIGSPFCGELGKIEAGDFAVLEISSFQLETIEKFKPKISVILNFSRNHLDRYKDMQEYLQAKKRIFMNQDESDYLVLNRDEPVSAQLSQESKARNIYFSKSEEFDSNQAAVVAVGSVLGVAKETCIRVFNDFKGIEHRMENVAVINNIKFINDSKATTVDSCIWALKNIPSPVILIAGGKDKGVDYGLVLDSARKKVKEVILIGEAKKKIAVAFRGALSCEEAGTLEEAVKKAFYKSQSGDCILLSPMCSSFDMFSSYEERGRVFKEIVYNLKVESSK